LPDDHNLPSNFSGAKSAAYTPAFRAQILADVAAVVAQSSAFEG